MGNAHLIRRDHSLLFIVDVQSRLVKAICDADACIKRITLLAQAALQLGVPTIVSEQYPRGLHATVDVLAALVPSDVIADKIHFCAVYEPSWAERLENTKRSQLVLVGMEAHVCLLQTALGVHNLGYEVFVVADAVSSRRIDDKNIALQRLQASYNRKWCTGLS